MRLINIHTLGLEEYLPEACPPYAILSHTWETEEVSFADMLNLEKKAIQTRLGYQKIEQFCRAVQYGHLTDYATALDENHLRPQLNPVSHVWVDTCCIDKPSSAELSEAINSMFTWYQKAVYCVAFLSDYTPPPGRDLPRRVAAGERPDSMCFIGCRWFRRGWTLQEAPCPAEPPRWSRYGGNGLRG